MAGSREASAAPSSEGDTIDDSRLAPPNVEDTASTSDVPARTATPSSTRGTKRPRSGVKRPRPKKGTTVFVNEGVDETEDDAAPVSVQKSGSAEPDVIKSTGTAVGTRRQANGTVGSVYSGSKIRHIKKPDGIPLWRKEIQYAFLQEVVHDEKRCFTRLSDGKKDCTFAEIYIDSMARSSKTSKILKDRLMVDTPAAQNMAMICLLVNVGRMNTTLNFFPEMRAQLRTYHPIPALQAYPTQKDYKSLQDAPRLKSILKGASEDEEQPRTLSQLRAASVPRCNPVNLIFVLSQAANEISQLHFLDKIDFFDLAIRPTISSHSRAVAFLWLMWWYLESDFTKEAALNNPFGAGQYKAGEDPADPKAIPLLVPPLEHISEEEGDRENVDAEVEIRFGEKMTKERERLNAKFAEEEAVNEANGREIEHKGVKRLKRTARDLDDLDSSDVDSRASPGFSARSPAPGDTPSMLMADGLEDDLEVLDAHPGKGRYKRVKGKNTPSRGKGRASDLGSVSRFGGRSRLGLASDRGTPDTTHGTPQPMPPGVHHPVLSQHRRIDAGLDSISAANGGATKRARTGYQRELEEWKQERIDVLILKKRREALKEQRQKRKTSEPDMLVREMYRISQLAATYDSEEDETASFGYNLIRNAECPNRPHNGTGLGGLLSTTESVKRGLLFKEKSDGSDAGLKKEKDENAASKTHDVDFEDELGEEADSWKRIIKRTSRRLFRWSGDKDVEDLRLFKQRQATGTRQYVDGSRSRPVSVGGGLPASSVAESTPRKPKKVLDAEIDADLLRSADEADEDGDTVMDD